MDCTTTLHQYYVGIDWGRSEHHVAVLADDTIVGQRSFPHIGKGLRQLVDWLAKVCEAPPATIAVALEVPHGPVVEQLLERGFQVHSLNPKQLERMRDRHTVAGAKDDRRDAYVIADGLRNDRKLYRYLRPRDPLVVEMCGLSRLRHELVHDLTQNINRAHDYLWRFYPQFEALGGAWDNMWVLDLYQLVPTPAAARQVSRKAVAEILAKRRVRRLDAGQVLRILRQQPLALPQANIDSLAYSMAALVARLRPLLAQSKEVEARLEQVIKQISASADAQPSDLAILLSMPGMGTVIVAILWAEAAELLIDRNYRALRLLSGVAPVTRKSGRMHVVLIRRACNKRLRYALYHWARVAMQKDPICKAKYAELRARGRSHATALRVIGDRLLYVACTMLNNGTLFDPQHRHVDPAA